MIVKKSNAGVTFWIYVQFRGGKSRELCNVVEKKIWLKISQKKIRGKKS